MDFITQKDIETIAAYADQDVELSKHKELSIIYNKLGHFCSLLEKNGFSTELRKDPRKQAGPGRFVFQRYQWAKVVPKAYKDDCKDKFAYIVGLSGSLHFHIRGVKDCEHHEASESSSEKSWTKISLDNIGYDDLVQKFIAYDEDKRNLFEETGAALGIATFKKVVQKRSLANMIDLLKYKKQIILQGPPGTGKTYTAKKIAQQLTKKTFITEEDIKSLITVSKTINSSGNFTSYTIDSYTKNGINVITTGGKVYEAKFTAIIDSFARKTWENGQVTNGNDSYNAAIAKYLDDHFNKQVNTDQFKLIQFHPAYSYEDFVRGITVKPNGQHVAYAAENKVLAKFAERALQNYLNSKKSVASLSKEKWLDQEFIHFVEKVDSEVIANDQFKLSDKVAIISVEDDAFKYGGNSWEVRNQQRMKFSDVKFELLAEVQSRKDIQALNSVSGRAKQHATYDLLVVEKLREFLQTRPPFNPDTAVVEEEKNYVLIIDEINRANLPAVLGELIYALEYRGGGSGKHV